MKNKGQVLVEAVVIAPLLFALVFFLGFTAFETLGRVLINHLAEKALICETTATLNSCQPEFRQKIEKFSGLWRIQKYEISKNRDSYQLNLEIRFPMQRLLKLQKELAWSDQGPRL